MAIANLSGVLATAAGPHLYWIASRAAGSAALILSSVSVCIGTAPAAPRELSNLPG